MQIESPQSANLRGADFGDQTAVPAQARPEGVIGAGEQTENARSGEQGWWQTPFARYAIALLSVELAVLARMQLDSALGTRAVHATFYLAVIVSSVLGGWRAGAVALVLGELASAWYFQNTSAFHFFGSNPTEWIGNGIYFLVGGVAIFCIEGQRVARQRTEAALERLQQEARQRRYVEGERSQLLLELEEERVRLSTVLQQSPIGVVIESPSGKALFGNGEAARILRRSSLTGAHPGEPNHRWRALHANGRPYEPREWPLSRAITSGEVVKEEEIQIEFAEGGRIHVSVNAAPIEDSERRIAAAIMTLQDITARKGADHALAESEERYRSLFENNLDPIFTVDLQGRFLTVNPAGLRLFGYTLAELQHLPVTAICAPERSEQAMRHLACALCGEPEPLETVLITKGGRRLDLFITGGPIMVKGEAVGVFAIATDITERKRAQNCLSAFSRLGQMLSSVQTPFEAARIISEIAQDLFSWDAFSLSLCELEGQGVLRVLQVDTIDGQKRELEPHREEEIPPRMLQILQAGAELVFKDPPLGVLPGCVPFGDTTRPSATIMFAPIRDQGSSLGVLSIQSYQAQVYNEDDLKMLQSLADYCGGALRRIRMEAALARSNENNRQLFEEVSRQKQQLEERIAELRQAKAEVLHLNTDLEQRVRERTQELVAANEELEAFCYSVSHDLRGPLRSIAGFTQALVEDCADRLPEGGRQSLDLVVQSTREMDQLIDDLLGLSRLTRSDMIRQTVDLSACVRELAAGLERREPERSVEWLIMPDLAVQGDGRLLRIALENLLNNAWKFTSKRPVARIEFGLAQLAGGPAFMVRDNGAGFDMAYASKLFLAFQRLHAVSEFPGHGIGLATVQRIVHRHGGRAWATGEVGEGAAFYFTLPGQTEVSLRA